MAMSWLEALPEKERRGSRPRCLLFMSGDRQDVASRLTAMVGLAKVTISENDFWMPRGLPTPQTNNAWDLSLTREAKLGEDEGFLSPENREVITHWWLQVTPKANTPNWDIASTCRIDGNKGLLLVEAKAHDGELKASGKTIPQTHNGWNNHERIASAIAQASAGLNLISSGWNLSRDSHYQLSNRFAWSWKLASLGIPVVLVYLGFLNANEMFDQGHPIVGLAAWMHFVKMHSHGLVPASAWDNCLMVNNTPVWALIRTVELPLN